MRKLFMNGNNGKYYKEYIYLKVVINIKQRDIYTRHNYSYIHIIDRERDISIIVTYYKEEEQCRHLN